jgi:hypothetical protein
MSGRRQQGSGRILINRSGNKQRSSSRCNASSPLPAAFCSPPLTGERCAALTDYYLADYDAAAGRTGQLRAKSPCPRGGRPATRPFCLPRVKTDCTRAPTRQQLGNSAQHSKRARMSSRYVPRELVRNGSGPPTPISKRCTQSPLSESSRSAVPDQAPNRQANTLWRTRTQLLTAIRRSIARPSRPAWRAGLAPCTRRTGNGPAASPGHRSRIHPSGACRRPRCPRSHQRPCRAT